MVYERENKPNNRRVSTEESIERLKNVAAKTNPQHIAAYIYISPPSGTGVEYLLDIKTAQPNQGDFQKFNKQMLEWYAYRLAKNTNAKLEARIAIPFNPFPKSWDEMQKTKLFSSPLDIAQDIWVENQFCENTDFIFVSQLD
ncbi:MAG: TdeIII family type II restriction endonuclease [Nostoc sp.]